MAGAIKTPLILIAFAMLSVLLTASAAWLALRRPDAERLNVETRSRLEVDYSVDAVARRIEPLDPDIIRAAANDEVKLTQEQPPATSRRVEPANVTPVATAAPTATPKPGETPKSSPSPSATIRPGTTPTPTPRPGESTATPAPSATAAPSKTPAPTPTETRPVATVNVPTVTLPTIVPTLIPTPSETPKPKKTSTPANTPTPDTGDLLTLPQIECNELENVQSQPELPLSQTVFQNRSDEAVIIYKLEVSGTWSSLGTLGAGQSTSQILSPPNTYFKVTDLDGQCLMGFKSRTGLYYAVIDED